MARAFRAGVEPRQKLRMPLRQRLWRPVQDLASLTSRAQRTGHQMGPLTEVPALVRIENEHWVFERIEDGVLYNITHKLILHEGDKEKVIGGTSDMRTAMKVAQCMAQKENRIVMIQPV